MAPEYYGLPENSITHSSRNHFDAIHCFLKKEIIKEEPIEIKCYSEYGVCNGSRQKEAENGTFYVPVSSDCEKNPRESKHSLTHSWKNTNFDTSLTADDQEVHQIKMEIKVENTNEDNFECTDDLLTINADLKMQTPKSEEEIDIVYDDIKPKIHGDKLSGNKSHPNTNAKIVSYESSIESWKNTNFDTMGSEYISAADIDQIKNEIKEENINEDHFECTDALSTIKTDFKTQTLKTGDRIDVVYEDIKPEIQEDKFSGKNYLPNTISHESSIDFGTGPQQNTTVEEDETYIDRDNEKQFQCNICSKSFTKRSVLKIHERTHTGEKPFHCNFCSKSFSNGSNLKKHDRTHTGEKPFQCNLCPKSFKQSCYLNIHKRTHTGEKQFQCNFCMESFTQSCTLKYHKRTHTGERPFKCNICLKSFTQSGALKNHERTHTGEKPFQCNFCLESFRESGTLKKHERTHTGEKSFQCNFCLKFFSRSAGLKIHKRTHTGEKPFVCCFCSKSFVRNDVLKIHERTHTE